MEGASLLVQHLADLEISRFSIGCAFEVLLVRGSVVCFPSHYASHSPDPRERWDRASTLLVRREEETCRNRPVSAGL
jgi:hypothetical protein